MNRTDKISDLRSEEKAKKFRLYKFIVLTFFVAFVLIGLMVFESDITLENIRYLVKYINFDSGVSGVTTDSVIYFDSDSTNSFEVFKGDLAVVNNGGLTLYDTNGKATLTDSFNMSNPTVAAGVRYLIVYDLGGRYLRIYNSFSLLFETSFDYGIQSVSVNDSGYFAVASAEKGYHSAAFVYNSGFEQVYKWLSGDKFIMDLKLNNNNKLFISAVRVENGELIGDAIELDANKGKILSTFSYTDELPLAVASVKRAPLLLSDASLKRIQDGELKNSIDFPKDSLDMYVFGEKYSAVAQNELLVGVNYKVHIFDEELHEVNLLNFSVQILDMESYGDNLYILTRNDLYIIKNGTQTVSFEIEGDYSGFEVLTSNTLVLCADNSADICIFE